jgi:hypothetical protein
MLGYLPKQMPALLSALAQRLSEAVGDEEVQQQEAAVLQECLQVSCCCCGTVMFATHGGGGSVMEIDAYLMACAADCTAMLSADCCSQGLMHWWEAFLATHARTRSATHSIALAGCMPAGHCCWLPLAKQQHAVTSFE